MLGINNSVYFSRLLNSRRNTEEESGYTSDSGNQCSSPDLINRNTGGREMQMNRRNSSIKYFDIPTNNNLELVIDKRSGIRIQGLGQQSQNILKPSTADTVMLDTEHETDFGVPK